MHPLERLATVPVEWAAHLDRNIERHKERIAEEAKSLAARLARLADEMALPCPSFNSLGEIQASGPALDRMLGELAVLRETRKSFHEVASAVEEKEEGK
jgi:hypothetical protein